MRSVELCYKNVIKELNHGTKDKWFPLKSFHILSMMASLPLPLHTLHRTRQLNQTPHPQAQGNAEQQGCPHVWDSIWRSGDQGAETTWTAFLPFLIISLVAHLSQLCRESQNWRFLKYQSILKNICFSFSQSGTTVSSKLNADWINNRCPTIYFKMLLN